jgi:hypothetical protein
VNVARYTITTTFNPAVTVRVDQAEFESLQEQGVIETFTQVDMPANQVLIVDGMPPTPPPVGTVVVNRTTQ